jgi:hypothetical protein
LSSVLANTHAAQRIAAIGLDAAALGRARLT